MGLFDRTAAAAARATGMIDRLGIDRAEYLGDDPLRVGQNLRSKVMRCRSCTYANACTSLLATTDRLDAAPAFCPNKAKLDRLARK